MKKLFLFAGIFALMSTLTLRAQVTIGIKQAPNVNAVLDLEAPNGNLGLLLPHVALTDTMGTAAPFTENVKGLLVYDTIPSANGQIVPGVYYNDGRRWWPVGGGSATAASASASPWMISGTTTPSASNTDSIYQMGSVAVGTAAAPDPTAILNVQSTDQGVLFPRVTLTSSTDSATIAHPTTGLLVYNTGADANFPTIGYMYWNGTAWKLFAAGTADAAHATLECSGANASPSIQVVGGTPIPDGTLLQVPYNVSNGGMYNSATLVSTGNPNVTATISSGNLMAGSGVLSFTMQGTPTVDQQAPNGITFDLTPFLDANPGITGCNSVTIANVLTASIQSTAVMGYLMPTTDNSAFDSPSGPGYGRQGYALICNSPDGKWSVRVNVPSQTTTVAFNNQTINVQLRNNSATSDTIIWNYDTQYGGGDINSNGVLKVPPMQWGGNNDAASSTWQNYSGTANNGYWGNIGIYDGVAIAGFGGGPEYRRYTWLALGPTNSTAYEIHVMAAIDAQGGSTSVPPTKVKAYIKFEQIAAAQ